METSSDDRHPCLSQIWSRYEVIHSKMSCPTSVTSDAFEWEHSNNKNSREQVIDFNLCNFFPHWGWMKNLIFSPPLSKRLHAVLENELFISVFSSELGVCVIIVAGYRTLITHWGQAKFCLQHREWWRGANSGRARVVTWLWLDQQWLLTLDSGWLTSYSHPA